MKQKYKSILEFLFWWYIGYSLPITIFTTIEVIVGG
jgi:hypothetical protein